MWINDWERYVQKRIYGPPSQEICIKLKSISGPSALDSRSHISVPVFVNFGDGRTVQAGPLMRKGNAPVRPPWRE